MGEDVPDSPPGYETGKWWCCWTQLWRGGIPVAVFACCKLGEDLNAWIASQGDGNTQLCGDIGNIDYATLEAVTGPWDTQGDCEFLCGFE